MRAVALALLLLVARASAHDLLSPASDKAPTPRPSLSMSDPVIQKAVREVLAEHPPTPLKRDGRALSADPYASFARKMDEAKVPSCWRPDAMKFQPPRIGPIGIGGLLALPFWGLAIVRGKCNR